MRKWLGILCCLCALWACEERDSELNTGRLSNSYLPLTEGNYWEFKAIHAKSNAVVLRREVRARAQVNGREYVLVTSGSPSTGSYVDSLYYRTEANGNVYTYRKGTSDEVLAFKLFAEDGEVWKYQASDGDDMMNVTVHVGTVEIGSASLDNCKSYYYDVDAWVDEEHTITLAEGVGFVREYADAWGTGMYLSKASIDGYVVEY